MFEKKGVWHSQLVAVSDPHGIRVKFTGTPTESKYSTEAAPKPRFCGFTLESGDEHFYTMENDDIDAYLTENIRRGEWCVFGAYGSRDAATVDLLYDEATDTLPQQAPAATDTLPQQSASKMLHGPPETEWPDEDAVQATLENQQPRTVDDVYLASFLRAFNLEKRFTKETGVPLTENVRCIATSLRIDSK